MADPKTRAAVLAAAHTWLDTPYHHQASSKGAGTDCLGLIRGIWRELYGDEPERPPQYTPDWGEAAADELLHEAAQRWLTLIPIKDAKPGDVMLFRMSDEAPCKHIGIRASDSTFIHAYWGKAVTESFLVPYWQRRWVYSFAFPSLIPKDNL